MVIIGHRGACGHAPEHTFASWDRAVELGADYLEQDLQMTRDGVLIVMHDASLDRTTSGRGDVANFTFDEIRELDAGSWFDARFADERVPSLREVFERYGREARYYIETKTPESAPGMEEKLLELINEFGLRAGAIKKWQLLIQSFSTASLKKIRQLDSELPLIQLVDKDVSSAQLRTQLRAIQSYAVGIGPARTSVDAPLVDAAHAQGLVVHPYTVNDEAEMSRLQQLGVDGMFTDFPDRLARLLGR